MPRLTDSVLGWRYSAVPGTNAASVDRPPPRHCWAKHGVYPRVVDGVFLFHLCISQHFAIAMGHSGIDFRALLGPIFERAAIGLFASRVRAACDCFQEAFTILSLSSYSASVAFTDATGAVALRYSPALLDFGLSQGQVRWSR
jgi:hypothetical protein